MPIYAPGRRDRHNRPLKGSGRKIVAMLSLTAMVDMFTVLAVFLLQNYQTTGEVLELSEEVVLPQAHAVKELKPAHVVVVSKDQILLDKDVIATFAQVKEQPDWMIEPLKALLAQRFQESEAKRAALPNRIRDVVQTAKSGEQQDDPADDRRVTVQADKNIDILTVKKVMWTVTEAGASEVNFAVIKLDEVKK
ncbi:MAG TPA: biopolymer transporter ExbD, partial [Bdellovibrionales bacterium]|nr:biopolymer transporter ExbD [Bdellovibrionales bacterium]